MKNLCLFIGILFWTCLNFSCVSKKTDVNTERPNVLFISIDDLNDWIEPMGGHPQALTPNLSAFSKEAVVFQNAYCASPSCNPSRTAMLTGKYPFETGLYNNPQIWRHILPDEITLMEYFKQAGYWTGGAGKIFHNNMPDPRSWDDYFPDKIQHFPYYFLPDVDSTNNQKIFRKQDNEIREDNPKGIKFNMPHEKGMYIAFDWSPLPFKKEETGDYSSAKWVMNQLKKEHDKPFFLACGLYRPHLPWYVPEEYYKKFPVSDIQLPKVLANDLDDLPNLGQKVARRKYHEKVLENGQWKNAVQGYLASINYADDLVGELLDSLKNSKYGRNTIVVIFSDHGWQLGEKEHWTKFALWENIINSVLIIQAPGSEKGTSCTKNVSLVDVYPTLVELCGLPQKEDISGNSLVSLLHNPEDKNWDYPVVTMLGDKHFSIRKAHWHYIIYNGKEIELYNLKEDPEEWDNLAGNPEYSKIINELNLYVPKQRKEIVKTKRIRWGDVLRGETRFYE